MVCCLLSAAPVWRHGPCHLKTPVCLICPVLWQNVSEEEQRKGSFCFCFLSHSFRGLTHACLVSGLVVRQRITIKSAESSNVGPNSRRPVREKGVWSREWTGKSGKLCQGPKYSDRLPLSKPEILHVFNSHSWLNSYLQGISRPGTWDESLSILSLTKASHPLDWVRLSVQCADSHSLLSYPSLRLCKAI